MASFSMSVWYADCVSASGEAFFGYAADLTWGPASIRYNSAITIDRSEWPPRRRFTLLGTSAPERVHHTHLWRSEKLGFDGEWIPHSEPVSKRAYSSPAGSLDIDWVVPAGSATLRLPEGHALEGQGQITRINFSILPWELPIKTLRCGRFIGGEDYVVWFAWIGETDSATVFLNGTACRAIRINEQIVETDLGIVELGARRVIREGSLGDTTLNSIPEMCSLIPERVFGVDEQKWLTAARLHRPGLPDLTGWAVHQVLSWPERA